VNKNIRAVLFGVIGILGAIATIYAMQASIERTILLVACLLFIFLVFLFWLVEQINLINGWSILRYCKMLGIHAFLGQIDPRITHKKMSKAKNIKLMAVSGIYIIRNCKEEIINALRDQKAVIRILLASPGSILVSEIEEMESPHRSGQISQEIINSKQLLTEFVEEAKIGRSIEEIGIILLGHYSTQIRANMLICDDSWGWVTIGFPPKRSAQAFSFELSKAENGLLSECIQHFDKCWAITENRHQVTRILPS